MQQRRVAHEVSWLPGHVRLYMELICIDGDLNVFECANCLLQPSKPCMGEGGVADFSTDERLTMTGLGP